MRTASQLLTPLAAALALSLLASCGSGNHAPAFCNDDAQCRKGRVCRYETCWWPGDAAMADLGLNALAGALADALNHRDLARLATHRLDITDMVEVLGYPSYGEALAVHDVYLLSLEGDLLDLYQEEPFTGCVATDLELGAFAPFTVEDAEGEDRGVIRYVGNRLFLTCTANGREYSRETPVGSLLYDGLRWIVLSLSGASMPM